MEETASAHHVKTSTASGRAGTDAQPSHAKVSLIAAPPLLVIAFALQAIGTVGIPELLILAGPIAILPAVIGIATTLLTLLEHLCLSSLVAAAIGGHTSC